MNYAAFLFPVAAATENKLLPVILIVTLGAAAYVAWPWRLRFWTPIVAALGLLLTWSLLSALWSIDAGHSLARFGRLTLAVAGGLLLCRLALSFGSAEGREIGRWLAAGLLFASAAVLLRQAWLRLAPPEGMPELLDGLSVLPYGAVAALSAFVLLATLTARPFPWLSLAAITVAVGAVLAGGSSASVIALATGTAAFVAALRLGRGAVLAFAVILPVTFVAMPQLLATLDLPARIAEQGRIVGGSTGHRLIIWRYATEKFEAKPLLGWGLHAGRLLPDRENRANNDPRYADILAVTHFHDGAKVELMPLHPHNAALQLWLELGGVGALLYAALYAVCLIGLLRLTLPRTALAGGVALVVAVFAIGQLSFNVWQSWWLCAQFLVAAFYLLLAARNGEALPSRPEP